MQGAARPTSVSNRRWPTTIGASVEMTDDGLVCGAGSILMRMDGAEAGGLALEADWGRLLTLLSVAHCRPVGPDILHHVEAASRFWQRGDKALANLRLVFAGLPRLSDKTDAYRLCLAEHLLDEGFPSDALMKELGLETAPAALHKYSPDQPRVPAGQGRESGEWTVGDDHFSPARHSDGTIVVAADKERHEDQKSFEEREATGQATPQEEVAHGRGIDPSSGLISGAGSASAGTLGQLSAVAKSAVDAVGPGRGPVYGTKVHTEFKARVEGLGRTDLHTGQSYKDRLPVKRGTLGSVRTDAIEGSKENPTTIYDLETGSAKLTNSRIEEMRKHLPIGDVKILEVKP